MTDQKKGPEKVKKEGKKEEHEGPETGHDPEHPTPKEADSSKGAGRMGNTQQTPEDQRVGADPKKYD